MASPLLTAVLALGLAGFFQSAAAMPAAFPAGSGGIDGGQVILIGGDCSDAAAQVVDETGGQLLSAQPSGDGQSCIVTVLVQGDGTTRPRKIRVQVPM